MDPVRLSIHFVLKWNSVDWRSNFIRCFFGIQTLTQIVDGGVGNFSFRITDPMTPNNAAVLEKKSDTPETRVLLSEDKKLCPNKYDIIHGGSTFHAVRLVWKRLLVSFQIVDWATLSFFKNSTNSRLHSSCQKRRHKQQHRVPWWWSLHPRAHFRRCHVNATGS